MITYSPHAETAMAERGIERAWVERTVCYPDSAEPDPVHPERMRAFRIIPERDGRVFAHCLCQER